VHLFQRSRLLPIVVVEDLRVAELDFRPADGSLTGKHEGSGLVLALSRPHAEAHGGDLQVFSELEKGTTVRISLPASRIIQGDLLEASGLLFRSCDPVIDTHPTAWHNASRIRRENPTHRAEGWPSG